MVKSHFLLRAVHYHVDVRILVIRTIAVQIIFSPLRYDYVSIVLNYVLISSSHKLAELTLPARVHE